MHVSHVRSEVQNRGWRPKWWCMSLHKHKYTQNLLTPASLSSLTIYRHLINTAPLSRCQHHWLSVCCGPPCFVFARGCVPRSRHLPIPPLACATLHLQGIKSEPPESTEKKDKKIGPNENQRHCLSLFLSLSLLLLSLPPLPWTWKDERGGELNLIQTSSPQRQMTGLWSVSVRVWVFHSLILSLLSSSLLLFLWTEGESLEALQLTVCWLV